MATHATRSGKAGRPLLLASPSCTRRYLLATEYPEEPYAEGKTIQVPRWQTWVIAAKAKLEELLDKAVA